MYEGSQFQLLVFVWCSLLKTLHIGVTHVKCIARFLNRAKYQPLIALINGDDLTRLKLLALCAINDKANGDSAYHASVQALLRDPLFQRRRVNQRIRPERKVTIGVPLAARSVAAFMRTRDPSIDITIMTVAHCMAELARGFDQVNDGGIVGDWRDFLRLRKLPSMDFEEYAPIYYEDAINGERAGQIKISKSTIVINGTLTTFSEVKRNLPKN